MLFAVAVRFRRAGLQQLRHEWHSDLPVLFYENVGGEDGPFFSSATERHKITLTSKYSALRLTAVFVL